MYITPNASNILYPMGGKWNIYVLGAKHCVILSQTAMVWLSSMLLSPAFRTNFSLMTSPLLATAKTAIQNREKGVNLSTYRTQVLFIHIQNTSTRVHVLTDEGMLLSTGMKQSQN